MIRCKVMEAASVRMHVQEAVIVETGEGGGNVSSEEIDEIAVLTQAAYDAMPVHNGRTLYVITG